MVPTKPTDWKNPLVQECDVSVVLEAFLDHSLDEALTWLSTEVPEVTAVEVGAGGYAPHPHLDPDALLSDASARQTWLDKLARHGIKLDALNVWGNPLHPDKAIADDHDAALRRAVRLAGELGTDTIVAMSGAAAGVAGDHAAVFGAGGWLPYLEGVHERQWEESVVPYWTELSEFAAKENPDVKICIELHPGTTVYNVETFEKFIGLGENLYANLDPSHFFWMQMDADRVVERIMPRIGHVHAKDVTFNEDAIGSTDCSTTAGLPRRRKCRGTSRSPATARTQHGGTSSSPASTALRCRRSPSNTRTRSSTRKPGSRRARF